jgi:hypothetical protein
MFIRNVDNYLQVHTVLQPIRQASTLSPPRETEASENYYFSVNNELLLLYSTNSTIKIRVFNYILSFNLLT